MKTFEGMNFKRKFDDGGSTFSDASYTSCVFDNCGLSLCKRPDRMSVVSGLTVSECYVVNSEIGPAVFEDVVVNDLKTNPILLVWSSFFRRVKFSGRIGKLNFNLRPWGFCTDSDVLSRFAEARSQFYAQTDWAIDISEARFLAFRCEGVPLHLIRRDPETQIILRKDAFPGMQAIDDDFKSDFPEVYASLASFDESDQQEALRVVPLAAAKKTKDDWKGGIAELRVLGFIQD
ncbi:hypothetical protein [Stenotrophomonas rhizophila]